MSNYAERQPDLNTAADTLRDACRPGESCCAAQENTEMPQASFQSDPPLSSCPGCISLGFTCTPDIGCNAPSLFVCACACT
mmetsp:Transcript_137802/g.239683  ORF Transcript_137802/g.239683 Transcript_137802/m.239683 type:complete len:81 (-) Transcript_137802:968-1210(-)